jgi:hypothetical protein
MVEPQYVEGEGKKTEVRRPKKKNIPDSIF